MFPAPIRSLTALAVFLAASAICNANEFVAEEGGFNVELPPGEPKLTTVNKEAYDEFTYSVVIRGGMKLTMVSFENKMAWKDAEPQDIIKRFREIRHRGKKIEYENDQEIILEKGKVPGREYMVVETVGSGAFGQKETREQIFVKGKRLYILSATSVGSGAPLSPDVTRFFSTFNITRTTRPVPGFQEFAPAGGRFSIEMPGTPSLKTTTGEKGDWHQYSSMFDEVKYAVSYLKVSSPPRDVDFQLALKTFREGYRPGAKIEDDKEISFGPDKLPGRDYRVVLKNSEGRKTYLRELMILSGDRVYMVYAYVYTDKDALDSNPVDRFFSTFKFTN